MGVEMSGMMSGMGMMGGGYDRGMGSMMSDMMKSSAAGASKPGGMMEQRGPSETDPDHERRLGEMERKLGLILKKLEGPKDDGR